MTEELQAKICGYIEKGNTFHRACTLTNISDSVFFKWRAHGEKAKSGKYFQFFHVVKKAEEKFKAWNIQQIMSAAKKGNWQAAAWLLERKYPDEFGRRERQEIKISAEIKAPELDLTKLTDKQLDDFEYLAAKASNGEAASRN